ncbi:trypsin-like serine protease [Clostridium botulinum]|nr:trypsin-like serine protease [Clostridium botulinum]EKS4395275.1 trypsin-like serine protease [Clostridium botulinum]
MNTNIDKLKNISVKFEQIGEFSGKSKCIGSGVIYKTESEYDYIFTAAHVVNGISALQIRYLDIDNKEQILRINTNDISMHKNYIPSENDKHGDVPPKCDIAVIRCCKLNTKIDLYRLRRMSNINYGEKIEFLGYPFVQEQSDSLLNLSYLHSEESKYIDKDIDVKKFNYRIGNDANINPVDRNEELEGLSGMGLFTYENNQLELIGIHSFGVGINVSNGICVGMMIELAEDVCKDKGWDIPEFKYKVRGNFKECLDYFSAEIEDKNLKKIMYQLLNKDKNELISDNFCGNSKVCDFGPFPYKCSYFINNLFIIACILKFINTDIDIDNPMIKINEKDIYVKYICSEGENVQGSVTMKDFVRSIKTDYLNREQVKNNSLIIWNCKNNAWREMICNKSSFDNIVGNIMDELIRDYDFDVIKGNLHPQKITIIHVNKLKEFLYKNSSNEIISWLSEKLV